MTTAKNHFKPSLISAILFDPLLGNDMTQFSKDTTGQTEQQHDAHRSIFSRIGGIFLKRRDTQDSTAEQTFSEEVTLPSLTNDKDPAAPHLTQFLSSQGEPTLLSIRRATELPQGVTEQVEFCAVHNYGSDRHILSYALVTYDTGQKVLHGYAREVGVGPLVSGPYAPEESPRLLSFEVKSHGAGGDPAILARSALRLTEVFSEHGTWGADEYLHNLAATIGASCAFVQRGTRFEKLLGDSAQEDASPEQVRVFNSSHTFLTDDQLEKLRRVEDALLPLDDLCCQVFTSVRETHSFSKPSESLSSADDDGYSPERKGFETVALAFSFLSFRLWAHFTSPDCPVADSVLLSLRLPPVWLAPSADMSRLKLQVSGPKNRFGMRERYTVQDGANVLGISTYSVNSEIFRNLFHTLHHSNAADEKSQRRVESLLDVLAHYDLRARPASLLALVATCRKFIVGILGDGSKATA